MLQFLEAYGAYISILEIVILNAKRCIYQYIVPVTPPPRLAFQFIEYYKTS